MQATSVASYRSDLTLLARMFDECGAGSLGDVTSDMCVAALRKLARRRRRRWGVRRARYVFERFGSWAMNERIVKWTTNPMADAPDFAPT